MKLIVGLGNPGSKYEKTRHNTGYMVLDELAKAIDASNFKPEKKFHAEVATANTENDKIILAKPLTFINLSGQSVSALMQFYKVEPENVWIIYDDIDLSLGQIRIRKGGSPGTHNGLKSIVNNIGKNFPRFRIGIESRGESSPEQQDISSFVLSPFTKEETKTIRKSIDRAIASLQQALELGIDEAMNLFNG